MTAGGVIASPRSRSRVRSVALPVAAQCGHGAGVAAAGVMQAPGSAAADDRFARPDVAELTIELATPRSRWRVPPARWDCHGCDRARRPRTRRTTNAGLGWPASLGPARRQIRNRRSRRRDRAETPRCLGTGAPGTSARGFCVRPDPSVRGLGAARVLSLSRMLGPRYCNATNAIASSTAWPPTFWRPSTSPRPAIVSRQRMSTNLPTGAGGRRSGRPDA